MARGHAPPRSQHKARSSWGQALCVHRGKMKVALFPGFFIAPIMPRGLHSEEPGLWYFCFSVRDSYVWLINSLALTSRPAFCSLAFDRLFAFLPFCWLLFGAFIFQEHFALLDPLCSSLSLCHFPLWFWFPLWLTAHSFHTRAKWRPSSHKALTAAGFCCESQMTPDYSQPPDPWPSHAAALCLSCPHPSLTLQHPSLALAWALRFTKPS